MLYFQILKRLNGQQINYTSDLLIFLNIICLGLYYYLEKNINLFLPFLIWVFSNIFINGSSSNEDKYSLKMTTTVETS